jgi:hypothetical protein
VERMDKSDSKGIQEVGGQYISNSTEDVKKRKEWDI